MGLRSGEFAGQDTTCNPISGKAHLSEFGILVRSQVVLESELITSKQLLSHRKQKMLQKLLDRQQAVTFVRKHRGPTSVANNRLQTMVLSENLMLDFVQPGLAL